MNNVAIAYTISPAFPSEHLFCCVYLNSLESLNLAFSMNQVLTSNIKEILRSLVSVLYILVRSVGL